MPKSEVKNIIIKSAGAVVRVESDDRGFLRQLMEHAFLTAHIPSLDICWNMEMNGDALVSITRSDYFNVKLDYPSISISLGAKEDMPEIIALLEYVLERARQAKGVYSLHSSCVTKNNRAVVIFGGTTNLGKTATAKTAADEFAWEFFADEKTLLAQEGVVGGIKFISNCDRVSDRKLEKGDGQHKIAAFVHPHTDNGRNSQIRWPEDKFLWHLNEELARKIRGCSKVLDNFRYPLMSLDTPEIARSRVGFAQKLAAATPCYELRGTPRQIADEINKLN